MANRVNLFAALSELTLMLLGGFLLLLALSRTVGIPENRSVTIILGVLLVYWALRSWMKRESNAVRLQTHIRAASLAIVGLLMISMPLLPLRDANLLVAAAGVVLVARGLFGGILALRGAQRI